MKIITFSFLFTAALLLIQCRPSDDTSAQKEQIVYQFSHAEKDSLIAQYLERGAWTKPMFSTDWQIEIDKGIEAEPTFAYFWQQKAMPLFKQGKYELGMPFLDNAVKYDRRQYLEYRGFMKCIFAKQYSSAIEDLEAAKLEFGNSIVMDHSYNFYIALSYLQLNEFSKAENILSEDIAAFKKSEGENFTHYLDLYYLGIAQYEQKKYNEAIVTFEKCLSKYSNFAEGLYYRGASDRNLGNLESFQEYLKKARKAGLDGYTILEDNAIYERYPYQMISWE